MKLQVDFARNAPDFIMASEGTRMQDPRFVVFKKVWFWRYLLLKFAVWLYDRQKAWLRKQEDLER